LVAATSICPADYRVPDGVQRIFLGVFDGNSSIERLTIPDEVYFIHYYAFANMPNLKSLTLSSGLTQMAGDSFYGSMALEELYLRSYSPPSNSANISYQ
ncbi:MAG: leucine-rich repeat protein, partial [Bacteroidales bacterium]|nr:leucine-rich repeat protein [Bacteroidales bacterium]